MDIQLSEDDWHQACFCVYLRGNSWVKSACNSWVKSDRNSWVKSDRNSW
jgi:hypothetical protein